MIRIGLIQFPGSNCERETALAVKRAGMEPVEFLWNESFEKLGSLDGYILIGGFSYEDRSRAGIIAALDPVMQEIKTQSELGKPILGLCNGAQILVESGLVPGLKEGLSLALTENKRVVEGKIIGRGYYNAWVTMRLSDKHQHNVFTRHLKSSDYIKVPVAHAQGRFLMPDELFQDLEKKGLNLFQYCNAQGAIISDFPTNPNGSVGNIAALSNKAGNIMAMMPHPERSTHGDPIFSSMRDYIKERNATKPIRSSQSKGSKRSLPPLKQFQQRAGSYSCLIKLIITDNQALTVQQTLRRIGFPVHVERMEHWEIESDSASAFDALKKSGLLFSERKERELDENELNRTSSMFFLVRPKDNLKGQEKLQLLKNHYDIPQIKDIKQAVVWHFSSNEVKISEMIDSLLLTHIIGNPYAHDYYLYE